MTPHQLPRTAKSAEFIEFTGPIKSLNSINRRLTHHITLHTHCRLTVLEHSLELSWYVRADKGSNKIWLKENSATYKKGAPVCPYRSAPLTMKSKIHVEDLLAPKIVLMFGAVD